MTSTDDASALPGVDALRRLIQSLAVLDAVLSPDWQYRYFSFDAGWSATGQMGSMRNGQGDHLFAHFDAAGCWVKGFAHEAARSPYRTTPSVVRPGVLDRVPPAFAHCLSEPAFVLAETTFCLWRQPTDSTWQVGPIEPYATGDPDGSAELLRWYDGRPETYRDWAAGYYERDVPIALVRAAYAHAPLPPAEALAVNPDVTPAAFAADLIEIGYPAG